MVMTTNNAIALGIWGVYFTCTSSDTTLDSMCLPIVGKALYDEGVLPARAHQPLSSIPQASSPLSVGPLTISAPVLCRPTGLSGLLKGQPLSDFPEARVEPPRMENSADVLREDTAVAAPVRVLTFRSASIFRRGLRSARPLAGRAAAGALS